MAGGGQLSVRIRRRYKVRSPMGLRSQWSQEVFIRISWYLEGWRKNVSPLICGAGDGVEQNLARLAITHACISQSLIPPKARSNFNVQSQALLAWAHAGLAILWKSEPFSLLPVAFKPQSNYELEIHSTLLFPINSVLVSLRGIHFGSKIQITFTLINLITKSLSRRGRDSWDNN